MAMQPWKPDDNPHQARRIGKTAEEVAELGAVLARISIQGMDAIDPSSGKTNKRRLMEEMADVEAQIACNKRALFNEDELAVMNVRKVMKITQMAEWEAHFK